MGHLARPPYSFFCYQNVSVKCVIVPYTHIAIIIACCQSQIRKTNQSMLVLAVGWGISMASTSMMTACLQHAETYLALLRRLACSMTTQTLFASLVR